MIYYANPSTEPIRDLMAAGRLGCIVTPHQGNTTFPDEWDVMADNGCFSAKWEHHHWLSWLLSLPRSVRFVVAPDVYRGEPSDHRETLARWNDYGALIERHGFTPAFVCQIGSTPNNVPDAPVLFLGGDDAWKLGTPAWEIAKAHQDRWIHMGRVNSFRRFETARTLGCDSCDGTYLTWGPDTNLPKLLSWLVKSERAPMLWEAS